MTGMVDTSQQAGRGLEDLLAWEQAGAHWRLSRVYDGRVTVELLTCTGQPVDRLRSDDPRLLSYVRARASSGDVIDETA